MSRDSGRTNNRSHQGRRSPVRQTGRSPVRRQGKSPIRRHGRSPARRQEISPIRKTRRSPANQLSNYEIAQQKVRELQEELHQKNIGLVEEAKLLEQNYGLTVDLAQGSYSSSRGSGGASVTPRSRDRYETSSPIRIDSTEPFRGPEYINGEFSQINYAPHEPFPQNVDPYNAYAGLPDYNSYDRHQPRMYHEDVEVRVDEMPMWPMNDSPPPGMQQQSPERQRAFSPTPAWRHQENVVVDPMPVFPMHGEDEEDPAKPPQDSRDEKVRIQMMMIARQAELAEKERQKARFVAPEEPQRTRLRSDTSAADRERENQRKARHEIGKIRVQVLDDMRKKEKEKDIKKREMERKKRHALQEKKEEAEAAKRREARKKHEDYSKQAECDEFFLKYLNPAIGKIEYEVTKIEGKSPTEYVAKCYAVNIPKELLYGSKFDEIKGECYKGAFVNYVDKLVSLGVIDEHSRKSMKRVEKLSRFLAELVEPLCNDIAIFGTQISVSDARDMRNGFDTFAKEKCAEFWNTSSNKNKLSDFMRRHDRKRTRSRSRETRSRDHKKSENGNSRRRETHRLPAAPSPTNEASLKQLFAATAGNGVPVENDASVGNPMMSFNPCTAPTTLPSLMSVPVPPPPPLPPQPAMMNNYMQPSPNFYPPQQQFPSPVMQGFGQYSQPMIHQQMPPPPQGFQQQQPYQQQPMGSGYEYNNSRRYPTDSDLMDEIFT